MAQRNREKLRAAISVDELEPVSGAEVLVVCEQWAEPISTKTDGNGEFLSELPLDASNVVFAYQTELSGKEIWHTKPVLLGWQPALKEDLGQQVALSAISPSRQPQENVVETLAAIEEELGMASSDIQNKLFGANYV